MSDVWIAEPITGKVSLEQRQELADVPSPYKDAMKLKLVSQTKVGNEKEGKSKFKIEPFDDNDAINALWGISILSGGQNCLGVVHKSRGCHR